MKVPLYPTVSSGTHSHLSTTRLQESEKYTVSTGTSSISRQRTPLLLWHRLHWNQWQAMHFWWMQNIILRRALSMLFCRALQDIWKVTEGRGIYLKQFLRSKHSLFWHALTPHYSFCTCKTSERYKRSQYTWPGGAKKMRTAAKKQY